MDVLETLPSGPLALGDIKRIRAHETVTAFTELAPAHIAQNGGLERAVALIDNQVVDLQFKDQTWSRTVLARNADEQRHLTEALHLLDHD